MTTPTLNIAASDNYTRRFAMALHGLRVRGVTPDDVLAELRISSDDDRWDGSLGEQRFKQAAQELPEDTTTQEELLSALALDEHGDDRRGSELLGKTPKRVYGPGHYTSEYEARIWALYCKCQYAVRRYTDPNGVVTDYTTQELTLLDYCPTCSERNRLEERITSMLTTEAVIDITDRQAPQ